MERGRLVPLLVAAATAAVFFPLLNYPFLNWDDQDVFIRNEALRAPGLIAWAFTTRYLEHYQPLAWLTWGAIARTVGLTPATAHTLNLSLHAACAAFVYILVRLVTSPLAGTWLKPYGAMLVAAIAALFWSIHPQRVEVVAWASAMPYPLALLLALLSTIAWIKERPWTSLVLFALSLLARPIALGLPLLFAAMAPTMWKPAAAGLALAIGAALAESSSRLAATLAEFGIGARLTLAATAPWRYLGRTIVPHGLTPLDPLALTPRTDLLAIVLGMAGIALVSAAAWRWRREYPVLAGCWVAYLVLLVPPMGFVPSGLQATADRYTYLAAVPLSVALAETIARVVGVTTTHGARIAIVTSAATIGTAGIALLAMLAWHQARHWRDSVALWTRAVDIDPRNDVALYNLATALDEAGRPDDALARYEQVLAIVPGHAAATRNRDLLRARTVEAEGNRLAASGNLQGAAARYGDAIRLDPRRTHAHAALGMALTQLGRLAEARPHLRTALDQGVDDPAVANALAYGLMQSGDNEGAVTVLREAQRRFPNDANIARNLAMLSGGRR